MTNLLKIDVSTRGEQSVSKALSQKFELEWQRHHPEGEVYHCDLSESAPPFVDIEWIGAVFTPVDVRDEAQKAALKISDDFVEQLHRCDHYLIATPMYNFGLPAALKAWVDNIVRAGVTFKANSDGSYTGLLSGKKATLIVASAGVYLADTPTFPYDFLTPYMRHILAFVGVTDVAVVQAGGTYTIDGEKVTIDSFVKSAEEDVSSAAKR
ncbi:FMN-dependent NADH-azoreductase [Pseudomonas sp. S2_H01]|jgi:FMN-dependent NADH-azoreductase